MLTYVILSYCFFIQKCFNINNVWKIVLKKSEKNVKITFPWQRYVKPWFQNPKLSSLQLNAVFRNRDLITSFVVVDFFVIKIFSFDHELASVFNASIFWQLNKMIEIRYFFKTNAIYLLIISFTAKKMETKKSLERSWVFGRLLIFNGLSHFLLGLGFDSFAILLSLSILLRRRFYISLDGLTI